jgi:RimJ/RimL family protein N-acetyltransferase
MSTLGRALVDGNGAIRVIDRLLERRITLRRAESADCTRLWEWANDPEVRAVSFNREPIPWETHQQWFERNMHDSRTQIWMAEDQDAQTFGQVRFDIRDRKVAEISVSIEAAYRQAGLGADLIRQAVDALFAQTDVMTVQARIKTDNRASIRAFEKAGFGGLQPTVVAGSEAVMLTFEQSP